MVDHTTRKVDMSRILAPVYLVLCVLLGGASAAGFVANSVLQLVGIVLIGVICARDSTLPLPRAARSFIVILAGIAGYLLFCLIPLPAVLWSLLPGREGIVRGYQLVGMAPPALGLTLAPEGTVRALLSFLPPLAMFMAFLTASSLGRRDTLIILVIVAIASILLGVMQIMTGAQSFYYLYYYTSRGGAVGFFANRNHLATLCLMTLPFVAGLAARLDRSGPRAARVGRRTIGAIAIGFLTLGTLLVQSIAGWLLLLPTLIGCLLVYKTGHGGKLSKVIAPIGGIIAFVAILIALFAPVAPVDFSRTVGEVGPQQRRTIMTTSFTAAKNYLPFGSGLGSFVSIYPRYEDPSQIERVYVNHAHNDYLELLLEGGIPAFLLMGALLWWISTRAARMWSSSGALRPLGRAATVSIGVLLAHSFVDYPFRTAAIAAVAAIACALLAASEEDVGVARESRRMRSKRTIMLGVPAPGN